MCTASWIQNPDNLTLFFNRDERRDRPPGLPPRETSIDGVRVIAPRDPLAGGAWIFANESGCAGALLNHYPPGVPGGARWISRGLLLLELAGCSGPDEGGATLRKNLRSNPFQPFHLLWFGPGGARGLWTWDGRRLAYEHQPSPPLTTSAWNSREVDEERRRLFSERITQGPRITPEALQAFHTATSARGAAYGVLMDREDACTVSLCRVDLGAAHVRMTCWSRSSEGRFAVPTSAEIPRERVPPNPRSLPSCP